VAICADTSKCASWDFESSISGWQAYRSTLSETVTLSSVDSPGRTTKSLAITFSDGFGGALINLCGAPVNTNDNLKLRAQVYVPASLGEGSAVGLSDTATSEGGGVIPAGTWSTVEFLFGKLGGTTQLGIAVGAGTGFGTVYVDNLEFFH
jgi:hypothetical protein